MKNEECLGEEWCVIVAAKWEFTYGTKGWPALDRQRPRMWAYKWAYISLYEQKGQAPIEFKINGHFAESLHEPVSQATHFFPDSLGKNNKTMKAFLHVMLHSTPLMLH